MKVSAININQGQNFKGIWGGRSEEFGGNDTFSYSYVTYHYYPFADDTPEQIEEAYKKYPNTSFNLPWYETGGATFDSSESVYVHPKLPFTSKEYNEYKASNEKPIEEWSDAAKNVSTIFTSLGLIRFLNKADKAIYDYEHASFFKKLCRKLFKK